MEIPDDMMLLRLADVPDSQLEEEVEILPDSDAEIADNEEIQQKCEAEIADSEEIEQEGTQKILENTEIGDTEEIPENTEIGKEQEAQEITVCFDFSQILAERRQEIKKFIVFFEFMKNDGSEEMHVDGKMTILEIKRLLLTVHVMCGDPEDLIFYWGGKEIPDAVTWAEMFEWREDCTTTLHVDVRPRADFRQPKRQR